MTARAYSHILVPTDLSPDRRRAYRVALATAAGTDAVVTLLHVAPMPFAMTDDEYRGMDAFRLIHRAAERRPGGRLSREVILAQNAAIEDRLRAEVTSAEAGNVRVRCAARRGDPEEEIARFVREADVDLIIMDDSPPGPLPRLGRSLAERLAKNVPAEVVRVAARPRAVAS